MTDVKQVTLVSMDGEEFLVDPDALCMSQLLQSMIDASGVAEPIPIPNVKGKTLKRVIDYCVAHKGKIPLEIEKPLKSANFAQIVSEEDYNFVDIDQESLFELILAANFLNIKPLLDLTCGKVASMIKGKNVEEIRRQFNIINDFTPEQEAQIRDENKWCEST